jgi:hypothetical protein
LCAAIWAGVPACHGTTSDLGPGDSAVAGADAGSLDVADAVPAVIGPVSTLGVCNPGTRFGDDCPASLCGNGQVDTCMPVSDLNESEPCDGTDFGPLSTCASRGYFGGTLACTASCDLKLDGCESCGADPRIVACTHTKVGVVPYAAQGFAVAAGDAEIDMVWLETTAADAGSTSTLHFTRFGPDFSLLTDTRCFGPPTASVSLARLGAGWVVGVLVVGALSETSIALIQLDSSGAVRGSHTLGVGNKGTFGFKLTTGPGGGALLTWVDGGSPNGGYGDVHALLLGPDGAAPSAAVTVASNVRSWAAASTGDGYALAAQFFYSDADAGNVLGISNAVQLFRLGLDGSLSTGAFIAGVGWTPIGLAWSGSDLRLRYRAGDIDPDSGISYIGGVLQTVGRDGTLLGDPQPVDLSEDGPAMALFAVGTDTVLLRGMAAGSKLNVIRLASTGAAVWPELAVVRTADIGFGGQDMAEQGGDAIVAWTEMSNLSLARVRVSP